MVYKNKFDITVEIMKANPEKTMEEVSQLIANETGFNIGNARQYYRRAVWQQLAPGLIADYDRKGKKRKINSERDTHSNIATRIMSENSTQTMDVVCAMIEKETGLTYGNARQYYRYLIVEGRAPGLIVAGKRGRKPKSLLLGSTSFNSPLPDEEELSGSMVLRVPEKEPVKESEKDTEVKEEVETKVEAKAEAEDVSHDKTSTETSTETIVKVKKVKAPLKTEEEKAASRAANLARLMEFNAKRSDAIRAKKEAQEQMTVVPDSSVIAQKDIDNSAAMSV